MCSVCVCVCVCAHARVCVYARVCSVYVLCACNHCDEIGMDGIAFLKNGTVLGKNTSVSLNTF